jgi:tetratricopeptide (TPR) repeat protein
MAVKRALVLALFAFSTLSAIALAQTSTPSGRTVAVIPFENSSSASGLDWLSEGFPEALREQLNSPVVYVASRKDMLRAYDREGVSVGLRLTRATIYRIAEQMDVDYAVLGSYKYDGNALTATAQLLDMRAQKLLPEATESAPLSKLGSVQSALAWDVLHSMRPDFSMSKAQYLASHAPVQAAALEHYIRGITASSPEEKETQYREAARLDPNYGEAWLELGKTYLGQRAYEPAMSALSQAAAAAAVAREANFYLGLAAYMRGDFARAQTALEFVAERLPLAEVYNNLGVVAARRGHKDAADYFEKAIRDDPSDPDYHFNLAVTMGQSGDNARRMRELRAVLEQRPSDAEAKALLDSLTTPPTGVVPAASIAKMPTLRIKRNYEEDAFRQMTTQMQGWVEQRFARSGDARAHARFHVARGKELLAYGFAAEASAEFRHAAAVNPSSTAALVGLAEVALARGDGNEARAQAEAALRLHESVDAYLVLARLDLSENRIEALTRDLNSVLRLDPGNSEAQSLQRALAAKLAEKAQPLQKQ